MDMRRIAGRTSISNRLSDPVRTFLLDFAVKEHRWPRKEVRALLDRDSLVGSVLDHDRLVGAAQILFEPPYPVERAFPACITRDGRVPCEVTLFAVERERRRSSADRDIRVFDALAKAVYLCCLGKGVSHVYGLIEERTIAILEQRVGLVLTKIGGGNHHWHGADTHGLDRKPTVACAIDLHASQRRLHSERPEFWKYLTS